MPAIARSVPPRALVALAVLVTAGVLSPEHLGAQALPVGSPLEEYVRVLQVAGRISAGSFNVRPFVTFAGIPDSVAHPWGAHLGTGRPPRSTTPGVTLDPLGVRIFANSDHPGGANDGAVWQGKGTTAALDAGVSLEWGHLSVTLHPVAWYAENASFALAPVARAGGSPYGYPWRVIDLPQRFGPGHVARVDAGQSAVRFTLGGATVGFGTENLWWGPGIHNAILMSDNAAGFPHGFLATSHPVNVGIGTLEARWIWGRLQESGWFESTFVAGQGRFLTGAVASLTPRGLGGLSLGMARVFTEMVPARGLNGSEYLLVLQRGLKSDFSTPANPGGNDQRDQMASLFIRWVMPASGFEAYVEWARNDHAWNLRDYLLEPEQSQAYTLGFQKTAPLTGERILSVGGEVTHLERAPTLQVRVEPVYYAHHFVLPGYTQRGQVIGSALGPGGDGQYLSADIYTRRGHAGAFLLREVHDNDAYWAQAPTDGTGHCCNDVTAGGGGRVMAFVDGLELSGSAALTRELNRYFVHWRDVWNLNLMLSVTWRP